MPDDGYDVRPATLQGSIYILPDSVFRWMLAWVPFKFSTFMYLNTLIILLNTLLMFSIKIWDKWKGKNGKGTANKAERTSKRKGTGQVSDCKHTECKQKTNGSPTKYIQKLFSKKSNLLQNRERTKYRLLKYERDDPDYESPQGGGATLDEITWLSSSEDSICHTALPTITPVEQISSESQLQLGDKKQKVFRSMPPDFKFEEWFPNEEQYEHYHHPHSPAEITAREANSVKQKDESIKFYPMGNPDADFPYKNSKTGKPKRKKLKKQSHRNPHKSKTTLIHAKHEKLNKCSQTRMNKPAKTKNDSVELVSSLTSVWSNSIGEPKRANPHSSSSVDNQPKSNKSELSVNLKRDSWIWFSPLSQASVENFATRQSKFCSTDPRVPQLIEEIHRQDQMNKDIQREAISLVVEMPSNMLPYDTNKSDRFEAEQQKNQTRQHLYQAQNVRFKPIQRPKNKHFLRQIQENVPQKLRPHIKRANSIAYVQSPSSGKSRLNHCMQDTNPSADISAPPLKPHCEANKVLITHSNQPAIAKQAGRRNQHRFHQSKVVHGVRSAPEKIREEGVTNIKSNPHHGQFSNIYNISNVSTPHGDGESISLSPTTSKQSPPFDFSKVKYDFSFAKMEPAKKRSPLKGPPYYGRKRLYRTRSEFDLRESGKHSTENNAYSNYKVKPSKSCMLHPCINKSSPERSHNIALVKVLNCIQHESSQTTGTLGLNYNRHIEQVDNLEAQPPQRTCNANVSDIFLNRAPVANTREESESDSFFMQSSSLDNSKGTAQIGQEVSRTIKKLIFDNDSASSVSITNVVNSESNKPKSPPHSVSAHVRPCLTNKPQKQQSAEAKSEDAGQSNGDKTSSQNASPRKQRSKSVFSPKYYLGKRAHSNLKKYGVNKQ